MSKRTMMAALVLGLACSGALLAEDAGKPMAMPKPGAEIQKLGYFVGTWKTDGDMKPGPFGPGGKFNGTDACTWFDGGFTVVCKSSGKSPMGAMKGLGLMSYSAEEKQYLYFGVDNMGMAEHAIGHLDNDVWTYTNEAKMGGKSYKARYTMSNTKPDSYSFKYETSEDGTTWATMMEGKNVRQARTAAAAKDAKLPAAATDKKP